MRLISQWIIIFIAFIQLNGLNGETVYVNVDDITTFTRVVPCDPVRAACMSKPQARTHLHLLNAEALFVTDTPEEVWKKVQAGMGHD